MIRIVFLIIAILSILFSSCSVHLEQPSADFMTILKQKAIPTKKLRFNGGYNKKYGLEDYNVGVDHVNGKPTRYVDTLFLKWPLFFFENGLVMYDFSSSLDSTDFCTHMLKFGTIKKSWIIYWGVYEIKDSLISAKIFVTFGGQVGLRECNFEGILKNEDTILQWRMVPPYIKVPLSNDWIVSTLKEPRDLYFKTAPIKQLIDPEKAWINEFKNKMKKGKKRKK